MVPRQYRVAGGTAKEISDTFEDAIRAGAVVPGGSLPTVRALAADLNVAPGTVAAAYKALRDRGVVETRGRRGTFVRPRPPVTARSVTMPVGAGITDLASGQPDPLLLPVLSPEALGAMSGPAAAPATPVLGPLLDLASQRLTDDGVPTAAITLASGGLDAIHRLLAAHLRPGDIVAVEDPGWPNALDLVAALGLRCQPMAVDADGPRPDAFHHALRAGAGAVIVTSRAHNPTGGFVTRRRARELRRHLVDYPHTLVIEDDHAAELSHVELASVAGATASWAFVRSMSKPYGPDLRLAVIAGDDATIARVEGRMRADSGWVSTLLQRLTVHLWTDDQATQHIAAAANTYAARRDQLMACLAERGVASAGSTGLNVWVPVADETAVVASLLQTRWAVAPGARFRQDSEPGIRITVSNLTEATIPRMADDTARALAAPTPTSLST